MGNFSADKWLSGVLVIDNVIYVTKNKGNDDYEDEYTTYLYTLPEYRKYILGDPNGVEAVPAMVHTVSKEAHDLMGRKVSEHHKGIVIKEGKKMINK